jgi:hypothetical protein
LRRAARSGSHGLLVGFGAGQDSVGVFGCAAAQLAALGGFGAGGGGALLGLGGRGGVLGLDARQRDLQPPQPAAGGQQLDRQHVEVEHAGLGVLGRVGLARLGEDGRDLLADPLAAVVGVQRRIRADLGPVDRDGVHRRQPGLGAQPPMSA